MKLSEKLAQDHESGDFGDALKGYTEQARKLEMLLWSVFFNDGIKHHLEPVDAFDFATAKMESLDS